MSGARASVANLLNYGLRHFGAEIRPLWKGQESGHEEYPDLEPWVQEIAGFCQPYTMTSALRVSALCHAVRYVVKNNVQGSLVECGVWRGGSMMAAALTLLRESVLDRDLYLFDTFEGMPPPQAVDRETQSGELVSTLLAQSDEGSTLWAKAALEDVVENTHRTGYPKERMHFVAGLVEDTVPKRAPEQIALLRLDTDWYQSTKHELVHLYPRLARGGVLIIDDYGHYDGARLAVDEYISDNRVPILLQRVDYTGRIGVKIG